MKIGSLPPIAPTEDAARKAHVPQEGASEATKVTLSEDAEFVEDMRKKAEPAPFRSDLVAEIQAQLRNGTFERNTDLDRVVDGLLADL
ncbi:MAG TPA: flagellar biosynthesis anti-sigma factor FlgM [Deltaproteobacteria bacterium]|nr:flagellar biosynthesis anti-sigma factor FlgM [Deltaproteobacteria bacterium]